MGHAVHSTVIGVLNGAPPEQIDKLLDEVHSLHDKLDSLLALPSETEELRSEDATAESLFVCSSSNAAALAFAANHSGLLVCPSAIGPVEQATCLTSGKRYLAQTVASELLLQSVSIEGETTGLVPAYWDWAADAPDFNEPLWAFDDAGVKTRLTLIAFETGPLVVGEPGNGFVLDGVFEVQHDPGQNLIGGPVLTGKSEVLGIGVAASRMPGRPGVLFAQPWGALDRCVEMSAGRW